MRARSPNWRPSTPEHTRTQIMFCVTSAWFRPDTAGCLWRVDEDSLDLLRFRRLTARARQATEPGQVVRLYTEALALWRGSCAAGLDPDSRAYPAFGRD